MTDKDKTDQLERDFKEALTKSQDVLIELGHTHPNKAVSLLPELTSAARRMEELLEPCIYEMMFTIGRWSVKKKRTGNAIALQLISKERYE